jgi:hypothetical protein
LPGIISEDELTSAAKAVGDLWTYGATEVEPFPIPPASGFFVVPTLLLFVDLAGFHNELNCFHCANIG